MALRRATPCDRPALTALEGASRTRHLSLHAGADTRGDETYVVEADGQLAGALALRRARWRADAPLHPWTQLKPAGHPPLHPDPDGDLLRVRTAFGHPPLPPHDHARVLDALLKAHTARRSRRGAVAAVPLAGYAPHAEAMCPAAYLQQLQFRSLEDEALAPWLAAGFRLEGWYRLDDETPAAIVLWENVRRG